MSEQQYERSVYQLERLYAQTIRTAAALAVEDTDDDVEAAWQVEAILFDDPAWEHVLATDISDIAYDACIEARKEAG